MNVRLDTNYFLYVNLDYK